MQTTLAFLTSLGALLSGVLAVFTLLRVVGRHRGERRLLEQLSNDHLWQALLTDSCRAALAKHAIEEDRRDQLLKHLRELLDSHEGGFSVLERSVLLEALGQQPSVGQVAYLGKLAKCTYSPEDTPQLRTPTGWVVYETLVQGGFKPRKKMSFLRAASYTSTESATALWSAFETRYAPRAPLLTIPHLEDFEEELEAHGDLTIAFDLENRREYEKDMEIYGCEYEAARSEAARRF